MAVCSSLGCVVAVSPPLVMRLHDGSGRSHVHTLSYLCRAPETIMEFSKDCVNKVVESYCPIVSKHKDDKFTPEQKQWQQVSSSPGEPLAITA